MSKIMKYKMKLSRQTYSLKVKLKNLNKFEPRIRDEKLDNNLKSNPRKTDET